MKIKIHVCVVIFLILYDVSIINAGSDWELIKKSLSYIDEQPYAVRYKISDDNIAGEQLREGYLKNIFDPPSGGKTSFSYLIDECLYVFDGNNNERFQYTERIEPFDIELYPDIITTETYSLTAYIDKTVIYHQDVDRVWEKSQEIMNEDYMRKKNHANFRFPLLGLSLLYAQEPRGYKSIPDSILNHYKNDIQPCELMENIYFNMDSRNISITFGDAGIPSSILYQGSDCKWNLCVEVQETGVTEEGFVYPQKAEIKRSYDGSMLQRTSIEVIDIIIGNKALEKFPIEPEFDKENMIIIDSR